MPTDLWVFVTTLLVVLLLPGPDTLLVLDSAARHGTSRGLAAAAGLALSRTAHVILAAAGLAALLQAWPTAFTVVRLAGAAYIVWLGVQVLRSAGETHGATVQGGGSALAFVRRGVLTNLLNPKALIFCSVLLPQFVNPEGWPAWRQLALLGGVSIAIGAGYDLILATGGDQLGKRVRASAMAQRLHRWLFGGLLLAFGARLALVRT